MKSGGTAKLFIAPSTAKAALGLFVYPGVGPEHAYLRDTGRVKYEAVSDEEAMEAFFLLSRFEGIIPAVESAHAVAYAIKYAKEHKSGSILACLSGREIRILILCMTNTDAVKDLSKNILLNDEQLSESCIKHGKSAKKTFLPSFLFPKMFVQK